MVYLVFNVFLLRLYRRRVNKSILEFLLSELIEKELKHRINRIINKNSRKQ